MVSVLGGYWLDVVWIPTVCKVLSLRQSSSSLHSLSWRSLSDHPKLLTVLQDRAPYSIHFSIGCSLYVGYSSALLLGEFLLFKILFYHFLCETVLIPKSFPSCVTTAPSTSLLPCFLVPFSFLNHELSEVIPTFVSMLHFYQEVQWLTTIGEWMNK